MISNVRSQSIGLIVLQVTGIILGFISSFYIASDLSPRIYSLIGIYTVIGNLSLVFSSTGIETHGLRSILSLHAESDAKDVKHIVTVAIIARLVMALLVAIPIGLYGYYMSSSKLNGDFLLLILLMPVAGVLRSVNDSVNLLLKAFNKYFLSALSSYSVSTFGRIIALFTYVKFGLYAYFIVVFVIPALATLIGIKFLSNYFDVRSCLKWESYKNLAGKSRPFLLSNYLSYIYTHVDQLLVSIFLRAEYLGAFSLAKNIWIMSKTFVENIFDPLCQKGVAFRNDILRLNNLYRSSSKVQAALLIFVILLSPLLLKLDRILIFVGLNDYINLNSLIYSVILATFSYILVKTRLNFATLYLSSKNYLNIAIVQALISLALLIFMLLLASEYVFMYLGFSYLLMYLYLAKKVNKGLLN